MKSIDPRDYLAQPQLAPPAGYICVLRDVDSDRWRIEGTRDPKRLVDGILAESESRFGIELVAVLETDDLVASAATLYEQHHAGLSANWLDFDDYQVEALRGSSLQIDARPSYYLSPTTQAEAGGGNAGRRSARPRSDRWGLRQGRSARQPLYRLYGAKSLKDYQEPEPRDWRRDLDSPERWLLEMSQRLGRFLNSGSGKAAQAVLILLLAALLCVMDACS